MRRLQINELLTHFSGVKPLSGEDHYIALCPCHNDHEPSLDIAVKGNKILMTCPVCGADGKAVMQELGLGVNELFYEQRQSTRPSKPQSVDYHYSDTLKKSRFYMWDSKKQRYKKSFEWQHKAASGKWQKGLPKDKDGKSISPPLYKQNLIESTKQSGKLLYIVEGEKDVDTLTDKLGLPAVCSPHGAGQGKLSNKWRMEYNALFKGVAVAIIPDNDEAGRNLANYIAAQLLPFAKSVLIVELTREWDRLQPKGDITDVYESETPLPNHTIAETVKLRLEALALTAEEYSPSAADNKAPPSHPVWTYEDGNRRKINEQLYITEFVKVHNVKCINNKLYSVDGAVEDGKARQIIIKEILPYVKTNHGDKADKLLKGIKALCYTETPKPDLDKLHFKNGTLSKDSSGLFSVWSDTKEFCLNRLPVNYNPNAEKPARFLKYLREVYHEDDAITLQEYCGYCLLPTTIMQKALIIIGEGGEGKSVLGSILNQVIGENNCYNESVGVLQTAFGVANVEGKLLFIDDDLSENALKNARAFKNLVTNKTTIAAQKKFVQDNQIHSFVRFVCFGNFTLQALYDVSEGFHRRQLILQAMPKSENRIDNPFLDREITENESEGVMMWFIDGLNRLIKNNFQIYISDRTQQTSDNFKHENDSVYMFLNECEGIKIKPGLKAHSSALVVAYQKFCCDNALNPLKERGFLAALKSKGRQFGIEKSDYPFSLPTQYGKKSARGFEGIAVSDSYFYN